MIKRVTRLILLLRERRAGVTAAEVAREIRVSYRQAYVYLDKVERAGLPLFVDVRETETRRGYVQVWKLVEGWR